MELIGQLESRAAALKADAEAILAREDSTIEELRDATAKMEQRKEIIANLDSLRAAEALDEQARNADPEPESRVVVTREARTYSPDTDRTGRVFLADVLRSQTMNDMEAQQRLSRHMAEERVERGEQIQSRAAGTSAFAGLVVPQYLTDLVAPYAKSGRPFADAIRKHELPASGMTVNISRITTATSVAVQTQGTNVSETDIDDTILTVNVLTNAGSQTVTRQAAERGDGVLDTVLEDLVTNYHSNLDNELLNQATNGLATAASAVTYTEASPTAVKLMAQIGKAAAAVEVALKDRGANDIVIVMHPRRWWSLVGSGSSDNPVITTAGSDKFGADYAARYGSGFRGVIRGLPVVVDSNIVTNLGSSTNQDEVYVLSASESHLWESAGAPLFIRTDTGPSVKSLGIDLVVYGYFAFTHVRYAQAQRITGTGLVTPA